MTRKACGSQGKGPKGLGKVWRALVGATNCAVIRLIIDLQQTLYMFKLVSTNMLYTPNMGGYKTNHWDCLKMSHTQMIPFMYVEFYWLKSFDVPLDVFNPSYLRVQQRQPLLWNGKDVQTSASP